MKKQWYCLVSIQDMLSTVLLAYSHVEAQHPLLDRCRALNKHKTSEINRQDHESSLNLWLMLISYPINQRRLMTCTSSDAGVPWVPRDSWLAPHQLGSRHLGVGTCARIAICHLGHCMQRFVTAGSSPERHVQRPVRKPWGPLSEPDIRHGAD